MMTLSQFSLRRATSIVLCTVWVAALSEQPTLAQQDLGFEDGRLNQVSKHVSRLIKLAVGETNIRLDRSHWVDEAADKSAQQRKKELIAAYLKRGLPEKLAILQAERTFGLPGVTQAFNELRSATRYNRSRSSSSGTNERSQSFSGRGFYGRLLTRGDLVELELREEEKPGRTLSVRDNGAGAMRLEYTNDDGDFLLLIQQTKSGRVSVVHLTPDESFSAVAGSFHALYGKHREHFDEKVFPLLEHVGVIPPLTPLSTPVIKTVLAKLVPVTAERRRESESLIKQLSNEKFSVRSAATKKLDLQAARHQPIIEESLKSADLDPETRMRLAQVMKTHRAKNREVEQLILTLGLSEDAAYLVDLLPQTSGSDRVNVAGALERLTGQSLGEDVAAWKKWLASRPATPTK